MSIEIDKGTDYLKDKLRRARLAVTAGLVCLTAVGCALAANSLKPHDLSDPATKLRAERIISTFENSTTDIQYGYAQDIGDGRGITAGRAGFTSGTGDLLMVVSRYEKQTTNHPNALSKYIPALKSDNGSQSTAGLDGFEQAWEQTSRTDPALNRAQDAVYDQLYFEPAMQQSRRAGVRTALGQLIILDTIIQQGGGPDPDGLPAVIRQVESTDDKATGHESQWLKDFLKDRKYHLEHAHDPSTRRGWAESADRVSALGSFLTSKNLNLKPPLNWTVYNDKFHLDS